MAPKIFNISCNKTATVSTHRLLELYGVKSAHSVKNVLRRIQDVDAVHDIFGVEQFEMFYRSYPDALFLLNTRPLRDWVISRYKHEYVKFAQGDANRSWPVDAQRTLSWVQHRRAHHRAVLSFFRDKSSQLLVCDIGHKDWQRRTLRFLGFSADIVCRHVATVKNTRPHTALPAEIYDQIVGHTASVLRAQQYDPDELFFPDSCTDDYVKYL